MKLTGRIINITTKKVTEMLTIDRFEGEYAVCIDENESTMNIHTSLLPTNAKEGDYLEKQNEKYIVDSEKTRLKREELIKFQDSLWE